MNNQFGPPGNAGFESWRRRPEPISPNRAPSAAEQLLHQVNSQPWQRGSYGPPNMDYPRTSLRAPSSLSVKAIVRPRRARQLTTLHRPTHGGTPHAWQEENERLKNEYVTASVYVSRLTVCGGYNSSSKRTPIPWVRGPIVTRHRHQHLIERFVSLPKYSSSSQADRIAESRN